MPGKIEIAEDAAKALLKIPGVEKAATESAAAAGKFLEETLPASFKGTVAGAEKSVQGFIARSGNDATSLIKDGVPITASTRTETEKLLSRTGTNGADGAHIGSEHGSESLSHGDAFYTGMEFRSSASAYAEAMLHILQNPVPMTDYRFSRVTEALTNNHETSHLLEKPAGVVGDLVSPISDAYRSAAANPEIFRETPWDLADRLSAADFATPPRGGIGMHTHLDTMAERMISKPRPDYVPEFQLSDFYFYLKSLKSLKWSDKH